MYIIFSLLLQINVLQIYASNCLQFLYYQQNRISEKQNMTYLCDPTKSLNQEFNKNNAPTYQYIEFLQKSFYESDGLTEPNIKIFCRQCTKQITKFNKIKQNDTFCCIGCFAKTQSFHNHFQVTKKYDFPILQYSWSAYQQVLLLHSIQKLGFGNWKQIKDYMQYFGAKFTQEQIQTHYNTYYLCDNSFLPKISDNLIQKQRKKDSQISLKIKSIPVSIASLTTHRDDSANYQFEYIDDFYNDQIQLAPLSIQKNNSTHILGYNQKRNEFDVNFDDQAQKMLANLEFRQDDLEQQKQIKMKLIQQYIERVNQRNKIEDFVAEHKILDIQYQKQISQNRTEYQKIAAAQLKHFMRFSSFSEHNELIKRVALSYQLKSIIQGFRKIRKNEQITSLKQIKVKKLYPNKSIKTKTIQKLRGRGRPKKIIQFDKSTEPSQQAQKTNNCFIQKMGVNMQDLQKIIKKVNQVEEGQKIKYGNMEAVVVNIRKNSNNDHNVQQKHCENKSKK